MELLRCRLKARGQLITPSNQLINCASRVHAIEVDGQSLTCFLQLRKQLIVNGDGPVAWLLAGCWMARKKPLSERGKSEKKLDVSHP